MIDPEQIPCSFFVKRWSNWAVLPPHVGVMTGARSRLLRNGQGGVGVRQPTTASCMEMCAQSTALENLCVGVCGHIRLDKSTSPPNLALHMAACGILVGQDRIAWCLTSEGGRCQSRGKPDNIHNGWY